jgi:hypothetical protein
VRSGRHIVAERDDEPPWIQRPTARVGESERRRFVRRRQWHDAIGERPHRERDAGVASRVATVDDDVRRGRVGRPCRVEQHVDVLLRSAALLHLHAQPSIAAERVRRA